MKLANLKVGKKFAVLAAAVIIGFGIFGAIAYRTVDRIKVSGPFYNEIIIGKDIVADILPPPEYIIESYLCSLVLAVSDNPAEHAAIEKKVASLRSEYEARQTFWHDNCPPGPMVDLLLEKSSTPARRFYSLFENQLLPLVRNGKSDEALALVKGDIRKAYEEHRAAIDQLVVLATEYSQNSEKNAASELGFGWLLLGGAAVITLVSLVALSAFIARSVTVPLKLLEGRLKDIAHGEGDLTRRVDIQQQDEIGLVAGWFNLFVEKIERVVAEVKSGTRQIDAGGEQIAAASQSLAHGASEQASSLEEISSALEEMSGQTRQSADNARQASTLADESRQAADRGLSEMKQMSAAVSQIKDSSSQISSIIRVIDDIAFQTNLLALNAAVEAARAGESGKGFAVVAEEVRNLAQRSAAAAQNSSGMIEEAARRSDNGVAIAQRVEAALNEITQRANKVSTLLAEIAGAATEQATGITHVSQGVMQLDSVTQATAGNSEELAASAEEMSSQVASLQDLVNQFKVDESAVQSPPQSRPSIKPAAPQRATPKPTARTATKPARRAAKPTPDNNEVLASF